MLMVVLFVSLLVAFLFYASYFIGSGIYLKAYCKEKTAKKVVALTFDDGPSPESTPQVLDVLKKYGIKAAFFVSGENCSNREPLLQRMHQEGHIIGNHSSCHRWFFPLLTPSAMRKDLRLTNERIEQVTGEPCLYFRPPFGVTNPTVAKAVRKLNLQTIGWSIRSLDTCAGGGSEKIVKRIRRRLHKGAIILLHDRLAESPQTLELLIRELTDKQYRIVRFDQLKSLQ